MPPKLKAVKPGDSPRRGNPKNLVEASEASRRELLEMSRRKAAKEIDQGVPAHALARLMAYLLEVDAEIRSIDAQQEQEGGDSGPVEDEAFDKEAL